MNLGNALKVLLLFHQPGAHRWTTQGRTLRASASVHFDDVPQPQRKGPTREAPGVDAETALAVGKQLPSLMSTPGYSPSHPYAPWCWNIYQHLP